MAAQTNAAVQPRIAVGEVADYTGRLDGLNGSVAPQGAALMVISALAKAGFPLAERLDLRIALQELDYANSKLLGPDGRPTEDYRRIYSGSIAEADLIVLGGITELDFNIRSDVAEASVGPLGGGARSYVMSVGVDLRLIDARSLRVVNVASLQKQIRGREIRAGIFEFIGNTTLDLGVGRRRQEPVHGAIRAIIEKAVIDLMLEQRGGPHCTCSVGHQTSRDAVNCKLNWLQADRHYNERSRNLQGRSLHFARMCCILQQSLTCTHPIRLSSIRHGLCNGALTTQQSIRRLR